MREKEFHEMNKKIKEMYGVRATRYEKLYEYITEISDADKIWFIRDWKIESVASIKITEILTVVITVLIFYITVATDILDQIEGSLYLKLGIFFAVLILAVAVLDILWRVKRGQYVASVIEDVERDRKNYDEHGKTLNSKLMKKLSEEQQNKENKHD